MIMRQKISSKLNDIILGVMLQVEAKYKDERQYKTIMTGLKSASRALAEITVEEIEDFKTDDE